MAANKMEDGGNEEEFPEEIEERLTTFDDALSQVEEIFQTIQNVPLTEIQSQVYGHLGKSLYRNTEIQSQVYGH